MSDNILPFVIFSCFYSICLWGIAQDVAYGETPEKWYKKLWQWFTALAITWMFGVLPSTIIFDVAGTPPDPFYAILSLVTPLVGAFLAAAVGLYLGRRESDEEATPAT